MKEIKFGKFKKYTPPPEPSAPEQTPPPVLAPTAPAFPHFTPEEKTLWSEIGKDPSAGWDSKGIPAFTTSYRHLEKMTGEFPDNGQPPEVNIRRIWSTALMRCEVCNDFKAALWVDRWELVGGYYCDTCHRDHKRISYLLKELNRKPRDAIISDRSCYLLDNPDFQSFPLFEPGRIAYLGASMGLGKTTAIFDSLAHHEPGTASIVLGPRISLIQALASIYRYQHGWDAWGLFHEGSGERNRYIGKYGAIGCLSALPAILRQIEEQSNIERLLIAIDEVDFSYELKNLRPEASKTILKTFAKAAKDTGIVVAGQTELLLSLESFAQEIGCEPSDIKAFYSNASPAQGKVKLIAYPQVERCTNAVRLHGVIQSISDHLKASKHVYAFFSDRRDVRTLEAIFSSYQPVTYTAFSKGERRAKALLENQCLTDSPLFLATSAAAVGINILDRDAVTVICINQRFGQRHWKEATQEALRNRARADVEIHYTDTPTPLPVKPSEAEGTSRYHHALKQFHDEHPHATDHAARDFALATLADSEPVDYLRHHLEQIAGMTVTETQSDNFDEIQIESLKTVAKLAKQQEREAVQSQGAIYLKRNDILTESEIRRRSIAARLDRLSHLAHERLNDYAQLVGWDGRRADGETVELSPEQTQMIVYLLDSFADAAALKRQRRGWLAVHFPEVAEILFAKAKADAEATEAEPSSIDDDRFRGKVLADLIEGLSEEVFTLKSLSKRVMQILMKQAPSGYTHLSKMKAGALGTHAYKQARFLHRDAAPQVIVDWAKRFLSEFYPGIIAKARGKDEYALETQSPEVFAMWTKYRHNIDLADVDTVPPMLSDRQAKQQAIELRKQGKTRKEIENETGLSRRVVERAVKSHRPVSAKDRIEAVLADGLPHTTQEIVAKAGIALRNFNLEVKKMEDVERIKRGFYQIAKK